MAQQEVRSDQEKFSCFICSELLKEPVIIPCGHNFCQSCIRKHWDNERKTKQQYVSCPICWKTFPKKTPWTKNMLLADLVKDLKKTKAVASGMGTKRRIFQNKQSSKPPVADFRDQPPEKQRLLDSCGTQQDNMCFQHNEEKKIFCRTDQQFICYLCHLGKHKGHDTVSVEEEMRHRRKQMEAERHRKDHVIQEIEKDIVLLQQKLQDLDKTADQLVRENEKMAMLFKDMSLKLTDKIRQQQISESLKLKELLREKDVQKKRLESSNQQLLHKDSYEQFLDNCPTSSECGELSDRISLPTLHDFQNVTKRLLQEIHKFKDTCTQLFTKEGSWEPTHPKMGPKMLLGNPQCPKTNEEFCNYSVPLMLDPNTANEHLTLSENKTRVTYVKEAQPYFPFMDRFLSKAQVLTTDPLPDRCYWEVEWSGLGVSVGVAYNDIKREGPDSLFGNDDKSWVLECSTKKGYVYKNRGDITFLSPCESNRVGVFLDHKAGTLCFYQVSQTNKLIRKFEPGFTQPLYAGLGVYYYGVTAKMCVKESSIKTEPPYTTKYL
ncbi:tripartite motif-containing protein 60-like [Boleophthalmus pectinirostris]|uniref:tripartite motif-containing protein 60-like n=1 Tax=Boleophthalmus pectinirostris TaxID=150288 RepID=UPI00242AF99E|nr:tripartite motif-containing protein 60-like [Boleophthalmus pectinirostris]